MPHRAEKNPPDRIHLERTPAPRRIARIDDGALARHRADPDGDQAIIDHALANKEISVVLQLGGVILCLIALHAVIAQAGNKVVSKRIPRMVLDLRARIFHKLQFMHFGFLDRTKTGRLLSKYAFDTQQVEGVLIPMIHQIMPELVYRRLAGHHPRLY